MSQWSGELKSFITCIYKTAVSSEIPYRAATCTQQADMVHAILTTLVSTRKTDGLLPSANIVP